MPEGTRIYVGNIAHSLTESSLRSAFERGGCRPKEVTIVTDRASGQPRRFAFIEMEKSADVGTAVWLWNGKELAGRTLKVSVAHARSSDGGELCVGRGQTAGGDRAT